MNPSNPEYVEVFSVREDRQYTFGGLLPEIAVRNAYASHQKNGNTWEWDTEFPFDHRFHVGDRVVTYGEFTTLVSAEETKRLAEAYPGCLEVHVSTGPVMGNRTFDGYKWMSNPENAHQFFDWIKNRDGIVIWSCEDLGNAGQTWTAPLKSDKGVYKIRPHWSAGHIVAFTNDPKQVIVVVPEEIKRWRVSLKRSSMRFLLSDASDAKVKRYLADHQGTWFRFDYDTQEVCIMRDKEKTPLDQWIISHPLKEGEVK